MLRITYDALEKDKNLYYYENQLFSGIVFEVQNDIIVNRFTCQQGVLGETYQSTFFPLQESKLWISFDALIGEKHEDAEPFLYQGKRFNGIAIEIDGNFCVRESLFVNGRTAGEAEFYYSGELESHGDYQDILSQDYEWFKSGALKSVQIQAVDEFRVEFKFSENRKLTYMDIDGKYFENIDRYKNELKHPFFLESIDFSKDVALGKTLFLASEGMNDLVYAELEKCKGFQDLKSMSLFHTSLSERHQKK